MKRFIPAFLFCSLCVLSITAQSKRPPQQAVFDVLAYDSVAELWEDYSLSLSYSTFVLYADSISAAFSNPLSHAQFIPYAINEALFFFAFVQPKTIFATYKAAEPQKAAKLEELSLAVVTSYYEQPSNADLLLGSLLRAEELERIESVCSLKPGTIGIRTPDFPPKALPSDGEEQRKQQLFMAIARAQRFLSDLSANSVFTPEMITTILSQPDALYILSESESDFEKLKQAVLSMEGGFSPVSAEIQHNVLPPDFADFSHSWRGLPLVQGITKTLKKQTSDFYTCAILIDGLQSLSLRYGFPAQAVLSPGIGDFWLSLCFPPYLAGLSEDQLSFLRERLLFSARNAFWFADRVRSAQYERRVVNE